MLHNWTKQNSKNTFLLLLPFPSENGRLLLKFCKQEVDFFLSWSLRSCGQEPSLFPGGYFFSKQATIAVAAGPFLVNFWCTFSREKHSQSTYISFTKSIGYNTSSSLEIVPFPCHFMILYWINFLLFFPWTLLLC